MNLLTPIAGFLIGYGGIMGYQVIDSTYKGEMPGPKSFGYFIGGMTLLSAATIYALGRTDKVFNAEGDSTYCKTYTSRSEFPGLHEGSDAMRFITYLEQLDVDGHTLTVKNISAETKSDPNPIFDETWITFTICSEFEASLKFWKKLLMKDLDAIADGKGKYDDLHRCIQTMAEGNEPSENWSMSAEGLSQFTPNELTQSSAIHGDFDHASLNYSGHQNMILKAEDDEVYYLITFNHINGEYETTSRTIISENEAMKSDKEIIAYQFGDDDPIDEGYKGYYSVHDGEWIRVDSKKSMSKKRKKMFNDYGLYAESFDAEGNYNDFIEDMEGVMGKYGEMKDFDSGYNPQDNLLKARMVVEVDDEDFDNVDFDAEQVPITDWANYEGDLPEQYPHRRPRKSGRGSRPILGPDRKAYGEEKRRRLKARSPTLTVTKVEPNKKIPTMNDITFENGMVAGYPKTKDAKVGDKFVVSSQEGGRFPSIMDAESYNAEVNSVMVSGSVDGEPAIFNYSKGKTDDFGFTPGRIATGENTEELFAQYPLPDIPHHRNVKGFKNYKNNVWRKHMGAETMMPEKQCVICGEPYTGYGHNPEPIFPMSRGRCCDVCNATVVIPYRLGGMNFRFGEDFEAQGRDVMGRFVKMDCDLCGGKDEVGYVDEEREFKVCEHCDVDGEDYNPKLWEAETARRFRNRFDKTQRGNPRNRAATGVKRNIWKNFFRKDAEDMSDELDMVMAQLYEIEDMKNPTPEDLTNYQNLLTRYYGMVRFNAEQKTARVRTMSGKPVSETLRKLKQDKNLSAKDARTRKEIRAENMEVFEAPRRKRKDFAWIGEYNSDKEWEKAGSNTIAAATKKAKAEGWKPVWSQYWGDNAATRKSRMRREAKVWNLMSKSPQWKPWLKFLTERNADDEMWETMEIFRGKAYWKDKNRTQDWGPWIYDEDRIYVPDHFAEDGGWQVLVKGNQALLLYYIADYDGPVSTPLMRKTFNLSPVKATKTAKKAKPKATKKTTTRKAKPKAKAGRKAPTISATRRKIGTRMRGNDGKMWEVKKSGKSQRWMAGAETFEAEVLARDWKWKGIKWTPEEEATLSQEEKEVIAEQLYNDWKEDLNS